MNNSKLNDEKLHLRIVEHLRSETYIYKELLDAIKVESERKDILYHLFLLLSSVNTTACAITLLCSTPQVFYTESIILSRAFFERVLNVSYLLLCEEEELKEYFQHTEFRTLYSSLSSSKKIASPNNHKVAEFKIGISQQDEILNTIKEKGFDKFIKKSKKGRVIKSSLDAKLPPIPQRLNSLVDSVFNEKLILLYQTLYYDDASEAIHGSLYGTWFPIIKISEASDVEGQITSNSVVLVWNTALLINELIKLISSVDESLVSFANKSEEKTKVINSVIEKRLR